MGSIPIASTIFASKIKKSYLAYLEQDKVNFLFLFKHSLKLFKRTFVKQKVVVFCFLMLHINSVAVAYQSFMEEHFSELCLYKFPTLRLCADELIDFKTDDAYQDVINLWQKKITLGFEKFFTVLHKESGITPEELYQQLSNEKMVLSYHKLKAAEKELFEEGLFIEEQEADPEIIAFIKMILFRHTTKRNFKIVLTDVISQATASYGSDLFGHTIFCNLHVYTKANIAKYYESLKGGYSIRYDILSDGSVRWIEISNFLTLKLIFIASWMQHQTDLLSFLLDHCLQKQIISHETICLGVMLQKSSNLLSAIFQSINPLESALFVFRSESESDQNVKLWKLLVRDIASSYSDKTLLKFKKIAQKIKQESKK